jgi:probable HAF family extracellular repeat protein
LFGSGATAQTVAITNITAPGAPFIVTALNHGGQVAGYFFDSEATHRAFLWNNGAALDLGTLGGSLSIAHALNNSGQVTGFASTAGDMELRAVVSVGNAFSDLGTLGGASSSANGLNDAGTIVGQADVSLTEPGFHAFVLAPGGVMQDLGTLGGSLSAASKINQAGQIIGYSTLAGDSASHAFLYIGGVMLDLGTLGGLSSTAVALNESGQVAGDSTIASEETRAFLFDGTTLQNLGTLGGTLSRSVDLNDAGHVIGNSTLPGDADSHGFIYRNGILQDLGTLGGPSSIARDLNVLGQVVGSATDANSQPRAFLWDNGVMTDLNTLLPANSGWDLTDAYFINDRRQVVGQGLYLGQSAWFLLSVTGDDENQPPVANAGPDQSLACGASEVLVTLDGSASSDPDGDTLTFEWFEGGARIATGATANLSLSAGSHTITLRVTDPAGATAEDVVLIGVGDDTTPPAVECPAARTVPAGERGRALMPDLLEALAASDNCSAASALVKEQSPAPGTVLRCGTHAVTVAVVDAAGNRAVCSTTVFVVDVTSPVVRCPQAVFRRARTNCQAAVPDLTGRVFASDNCTPRRDLIVTQRPAPGSLVEAGRHDIEFTVADAAGNVTTCGTTLHVLDLSRPVFSSLTANPEVLRPADGRMVAVRLTAVVSDNCDPNPLCRVIAVKSSGEDSGEPDWRMTGDMTVELRAELTAKRGPRVYTILVSCTDASGNTTLRSVHVKVPRN